MQQFDEQFGAELVEEPCGNPVVTHGQSPLQRDHFAITRLAAVARSPYLVACHDIGLLNIGSHVAGSPAVLHCQRVKVGLDGGADLPFALRTHVILEVAVVDAADVGFHVSCLGVHAHEACAEERLVVANTVDRGHDGVLVALQGVDSHLDRRGEGIVDFSFRVACLLHRDVAAALPFGTCQVGLGFVGRDGGGIGSVLVRAEFLVEERLQLACDVLGNSLFGIFLHAAVQCGVDLQAVGVDIVGSSLAVHVLVAPAIERVLFPCQRVLVELLFLPVGIVAAGRFLCHEHEPQVVAQVGAVSVVVADAMEVEAQRTVAQFLALCRGQVAGLLHLQQYHVAAFDAAFRMPYGIVVAGVLAHADEQGALACVELHRLLAEVGLGRCSDADGIVQEVEVVEVHAHDFLFRVEAFQLEGNDPLDGLLQESLSRGGCLFGVELLGQLLSDGAAAAGALLLEHSSLDDGSQQSLEVDAVVLVEACILGGNKCVDEGWRHAAVVGEDAVGATVAPGAQLLAVGGKDLCGVLVDGILQLLNVGHVANVAREDAIERETDGGNPQYVANPKEDEQFLSHGLR